MPRDIPTLYWDAETRSLCDIRAAGTHRYTADPTTDHILSRFRLDDGEHVEVRRDQPLPAEIRDAFTDPAVMVCAHNFAFERNLLKDVLARRYGWPAPPPLARWECTMARARACGLPGSLEQALAAIGSNVQKDREGHALMLRMCRPRRVSEYDDGAGLLSPDRFTVLPNGKLAEWWWDEERLERLGEYCGTDIDGSRALDLRLPPLPDSERAIWLATEEINDAGVRFDLSFARRALAVADKARAALDKQMRDATGGAVGAASNVTALKRFLLDQGVDLSPPPDPFADDEDEAGGPELETGDDEDELPDLRRADIVRLLATPRVQGAARRALQIRLEAGKTSTKKLNAMLARADAGGYVRGLLAYHGASTGRYSAAGGGVQIQNFPRDTVPDWDAARAALDLVPEYGLDAVEALHGPALDVVSKMLRGSIIPDDGCDIISVDYSAVELRGVAWLAGQDDLVEALRTGAKIYEQMAGVIYGRHWKEIAKDSRERWVGKQTVLGSGYQMGGRKFWSQCMALGQPVEVELANRAIAAFRDTYPRISQLWYAMNDAAIAAVKRPGQRVETARGRILFLREGNWLRMRLPSGRALRYRNPRIEIDKRFGREGVVYEGVNSKTKKWGKQRTFGGRWVENAVQGLCRDLMAGGMLRARAAGYRVVTTVHDEVVVCAPVGTGSVEHLTALLCELPAWAEGFPLAAEGWRDARYG